MPILATSLRLLFLLIVGFLLYISFSNDPACGTRDVGLCFSAGLIIIFAAPLALLTTPAAFIFYIRDRKNQFALPQNPFILKSQFIIMTLKQSSLESEVNP